MLKLNASYSKKVPAEGEYSSQSYHASIEVELPDGLTSGQLNEKIHDTFDLVRKSVESELSKGQSAIEPRSGRNRSPAGRPGKVCFFYSRRKAYNLYGNKTIYCYTRPLFRNAATP